MEPDDLLCSRNARPQKALVGRAQWKINQPPSLTRWRVSLEESFKGMKVVQRPQRSTKLGRRGRIVEKCLMRQTMRGRGLSLISPYSGLTFLILARPRNFSPNMNSYQSMFAALSNWCVSRSTNSVIDSMELIAR